MNEEQAKQLEERILREARYLATLLKEETFVGGRYWAVSIFVRSSGLHLADIESPKEWDELKQDLLKRLPPNNR